MLDKIIKSIYKLENNGEKSEDNMDIVTFFSDLRRNMA